MRNLKATMRVKTKGIKNVEENKDTIKVEASEGAQNAEHVENSSTLKKKRLLDPISVSSKNAKEKKVKAENSSVEKKAQTLESNIYRKEENKMTDSINDEENSGRDNERRPIPEEREEEVENGETEEEEESEDVEEEDDNEDDDNDEEEEEDEEEDEEEEEEEDDEEELDEEEENEEEELDEEEDDEEENREEALEDARQYFKVGQKVLTPPNGDGTRAFYESLLEENPNSIIAIKYCIEHGVLTGSKYHEALYKYVVLKKNNALKNNSGGKKIDVVKLLEESCKGAENSYEELIKDESLLTK